MRRGLTMIEMILAVALLSALTVSMASWLQVTVRTARDQTQPAQWRSAATAALQLIQDDLLIGDIDTRGAAPRVLIEAGVLTIRTRATPPDEPRGPVVHRYRFDAADATLRYESVGDGRTQNGRQTRLLLEDVEAWEATIDVDQGALEVTAISTASHRVMRRYPLP